MKLFGWLALAFLTLIGLIAYNLDKLANNYARLY